MHTDLYLAFAHWRGPLPEALDEVHLGNLNMEPSVYDPHARRATTTKELGDQ